MDSIIELRHLKTLLALEETGSVSLAAKRVFLTQSALSHQIRMLENHYGAPLFERKSTPLRFTPEKGCYASLTTCCLKLPMQNVIWHAL